jgi:hypothetical protein
VKNHHFSSLRRKQPARVPSGQVACLDMYMAVRGLKSYGKVREGRVDVLRDVFDGHAWEPYPRHLAPQSHLQLH